MPPVTVFARDLDLAGDPDILQPVSCHQPCVVTRATGDNQYLPGRIENPAGLAAKSVFQYAVTQQPVFQRVAHSAGLLVNFFLHEMAMLAEFGTSPRLGTGMDNALHWVAAAVLDSATCAPYVGNITVFEHLVPASHG